MGLSLPPSYLTPFPVPTVLATALAGLAATCHVPHKLLSVENLCLFQSAFVADRAGPLHGDIEEYVASQARVKIGDISNGEEGKRAKALVS